MNLLIINGGPKVCFEPFLEYLNTKKSLTFTPHIFNLSELNEGKDFPSFSDDEDFWHHSLNKLFKVVQNKTTEPWMIYAFGLGTSILFDLASRAWTFPNGYILKPVQVVLHGSIVPDQPFGPIPKQLCEKSFSLKSKIRFSAFSRKKWAKKLFSKSANLDANLINLFFNELRDNKSLSVFPEYLTSAWYKMLIESCWHERFYFIYGNEKSNAGRISYWKSKFPKSSFFQLPEIDDFVGIESPNALFSFLNEHVEMARSIS